MIDAVALKCTRIEQLFAVQGISNIRTQDFYRIRRWCITPAAINHLLRTVSPDAVRTHAARFNEISYSLLLKTLGLDPHGLAVSTSTPNVTLVAARARLRASLGGLGLMSAVLTSKPAFLGSLCLVSHMVASTLGDSLTEPGQIAVTFPELDAAVIEKYFANIPNLA